MGFYKRIIPFLSMEKEGFSNVPKQAGIPSYQLKVPLDG